MTPGQSPLQNRVAPDGSLHAIAARGTLMGNRGILHDPETKQLLRRNWQHKVWIACETSLKGRKRELFSKGKYTELFFLDEVTALSAGHRPCYECRRADALRFRQCLQSALPQATINAKFLNDTLHGERWLSRKSEPVTLSVMEAENLPDGVMFCQGLGQNERYFTRKDGKWLTWGFGGYEVGKGPTEDAPIVQITPQTMVLALQNGYEPRWHETAYGIFR